MLAGDLAKMKAALVTLLFTFAMPANGQDFVVKGDEVDPIAPLRITHSVDEMREDGELVQYYNFVVYEFETKAGFMRARTYMDENYKVTIYGPFLDAESTEEISAPQMEADVIAYLKRRFAVIERLGESGYEQVWPGSKASLINNP